MRKVIGSIHIFLIIFWSLLVMFPLLLTRSKKFIYYIDLHWWSKGILNIAMQRLKVSGRENISPKKNYIFMANHSTYGDIPLLNVAVNRPIHFFAKYELRKIPVMGRVMEKAGMVFVDRSNPRKATQSVIDAIKIAKSGEDLAIFPEGTRSKNGQISDFKKGGFQIAAKAKVEVVPVYIEEAYKGWSRNNVEFRPKRVNVRILPPVSSDLPANKAADDLLEKVYKSLKTAETEYMNRS